MTQQITSKQGCPRCGKKAILTDPETSEMICGLCGFVISERLEDSGPEWRSFTDDNANRARTGYSTSLTRHDKGLYTIISPANKDATGKPLSYSMKSNLKRLRIWDIRSQTHGSIDRNFRTAFSELRRMKDKLALSDVVVEKGAYFYRKALGKNLLKGRSISPLIAASLYAACRDTETLRTLTDFTQTTNIKKRSIAVCYRILVKELDLKIPVVDSVQCIARIASRLGISEKTKRYAIELLRKAKENQFLAGKHPMAMAASALYISCVNQGDGPSQKKIAQAADVTEITIRNRSRGLKKALGI